MTRTAEKPGQGDAGTRGREDPRAAIVAIGTEMLGPLRQDTNSLWLAARLEEVGIPVVQKAVVGDDPRAIGRELTHAAAAATLVLTTGGLGPTADDVTVAAVAEWLGTPLRRDPDFLARMRARFERRGLRMPAVNEKQADFLVGARVLENPRGTAPGFWATRDGVEVVILPGVPSEMREIMEGSVLPILRERAGGAGSQRRVLRIAGMGESYVEEIVTPVYAKWKEHPVTILASPGEVQLHLFVRAEPDRARTILDDMERDFREALGGRVFGRDDEDLSATVGRLLRQSHQTLSVAESCTGGMISALLTDIPGSSEYFLGGVVPYANAAKEEMLGVSGETLERYGAVSEKAACEMAQGARRRFESDLAAAVTGIAGPDGGTAEKPVGTVWFALAGSQGAIDAKDRRFVGDRAMVRRAASLYALELLRRHLTGGPHE
jgi:nicotinamide-nucleotide amidase